MEAANRISIIEMVFQEDSSVKITSPFEVDVVTGFTLGTINISMSGFNLEFDIQVGLNYPFKSSVGPDNIQFSFLGEIGLNQERKTEYYPDQQMI